MPSEKHLSLKAMMMPRDTNQHGTIFGGVLMSYIDQAAAIGARHEIRQNGWPEQPIVTVAMNKVEFHEPVFVGDVVSFYTELTRIGTTSISMHVLVETDRDGAPIKLTEATVTFVAVESSETNRKPIPIRGN